MKTLTEDKKKQLDGIVVRMQSEGESDANIQAVVDDFKERHGKGGVERFRSGLGNFLVGNTVRFGKTIGGALGVKEAAGGLEGQTAERVGMLDRTLAAIRKGRAEGRDTSRLEASYRSGLGQGAEFEAQNPILQKTAGSVIGEGLGTVVDATLPGAVTGLASGSMRLAKTAQAAQAGKAAFRSLPVAQRLGLIATDMAKGIGAAAPIGYLSDVGMGLRGERGEDRTGAKALIPGLGTGLGVAIPATIAGTRAAGVGVSAYRASRAGKYFENLNKALTEVTDNNQKLLRITDHAKSRGFDVNKKLAESGLLGGTVDKEGTIRTAQPLKKLDDFLNPQSRAVRDNLIIEGKEVNPETIRFSLRQEIMDSGLEGASLKRALASVDDELEGLAIRIGDPNAKIPLVKIQDAKVSASGAVNWMTEPDKARLQKAVSRAYRKIIERHTDIVDVRKVNKELEEWYYMRDLLKSLDGRKVKGGRMGKYFSQTVGSIVGSHFGPLGAIAGAEAGGAVRGAQLAGAFGKSTDATLDVGPEVQKALGQSPNSLGSRKMSQSTTMMPTTAPISPTLDDVEGFVKNLKTIVGDKERSVLDKMKGTARLALYKAVFEENMSIDDAVKEYVKNPKLGLSLEDVTKNGSDITSKITPENIAKNMDDADIAALRALANAKNGEQFLNAKLNAISTLEGMKINPLKVDDDVLKRFAKETLAYAEKDGRKVPITVAKSASTADDALMREARKYKSAEEFVRAQGTPVYHGSTKSNLKELLPNQEARTDAGNLGTGVSLTPQKYIAEAYSSKSGVRGEVYDVFVSSKNPLRVVYDENMTSNVEQVATELGVTSKPVWKNGGNQSKEFADEFAKKAQEAGYDSAKYVNSDGSIVETVVYDPSQIKTRSQLTDIWKKANATAKSASTADDALMRSAKGKTLEEFVKAQQKTFYRGGGIGSMPKGKTAMDVLKYENDELGNALTIEPSVDISSIKSENLAWLTEKKSDARMYGEVRPETGNFRIVARDGDGGVLVERLSDSQLTDIWKKAHNK